MATDLKALVPYWGGDVTPLPCQFCNISDLMVLLPRGEIKIEVWCNSCDAAGTSSIGDDMGAQILWNMDPRAPDSKEGAIDFLGPDIDSVSGISVAIVEERVKIRYNHGTPDAWDEYWSLVPTEAHGKSWKVTIPGGSKMASERNLLLRDYQLTTA